MFVVNIANKFCEPSNDRIEIEHDTISFGRRAFIAGLSTLPALTAFSIESEASAPDMLEGAIVVVQHPKDTLAVIEAGDIIERTIGWYDKDKLRAAQNTMYGYIEMDANDTVGYIIVAAHRKRRRCGGRRRRRCGPHHPPQRPITLRVIRIADVYDGKTLVDTGTVDINYTEDTYAVYAIKSDNIEKGREYSVRIRDGKLAGRMSPILVMDKSNQQ